MSNERNIKALLKNKKYFELYKKIFEPLYFGNYEGLVKKSKDFVFDYDLSKTKKYIEPLLLSELEREGFRINRRSKEYQKLLERIAELFRADETIIFERTYGREELLKLSRKRSKRKLKF